MFDFLGGLVNTGINYFTRQQDRHAAERIAQQNINYQREFAQSGIQWKAADARAAGIHPIYAMGAQTHSFSPVSIGSSGDFKSEIDFSGLSKDMGQDVSNAVERSQPREGRASRLMEAQTIASRNLDLENKKLQNILLASKVASQQAITGPGVPPLDPKSLIPGQGDTRTINPEPLKVTPARPEQPSTEPGTITDVGHAATNVGFAPVPSENVKQRIEDNLIQELMWSVRNNLMPSFGYNLNPPVQDPGEGRKWIYDFRTQTYRAVPMRRSKYFGDMVPSGWYVR